MPVTRGFASIPHEILECRSLAPVDKLVMLALQGFDLGSGHCSPTLDEIAEAAGLGKSTVKRALKRLIVRGFVQASSPNGCNQPRTLRFAWPVGRT